MKDGTHTWSEPSKVPKTTLKKGPDSNIDAKKCLTVIQEWPDLHRTLTLSIDASTHRVRRLVETYQNPGGKRETTWDFAETKLDAPIDPSQFKWSPPPGWKKQ
jgi:outer membrane lipoprotein-sorting protein